MSGGRADFFEAWFDQGSSAEVFDPDVFLQGVNPTMDLYCDFAEIVEFYQTHLKPTLISVLFTNIPIFSKKGQICLCSVFWDENLDFDVIFCQ